MLPSIDTLENIIEVNLSNNFQRFWQAHLPDSIPQFRLERTKLRQGKFADVGLDPDNGWIIRIRNDIPLSMIEISLAHEIMHLILYSDGYPAVCVNDELSEQAEASMIAEAIHSILTHPILDYRMKNIWGFPIEINRKHEIEDALILIEGIDRHVSLDPINSLLMGLTYIANRLDGIEPICEIIKERFPNISLEAKEYVEFLSVSGYSKPEHLSSADVIRIGRIFIRNLNTEKYCSLCIQNKTGGFEPDP